MALDPGVIALARTRSRKCYGRSLRACAEVGWRDGRCGTRVDLDQPVGGVRAQASAVCGVGDSGRCRFSSGLSSWAGDGRAKRYPCACGQESSRR